jgi:hypothetical protein
MNLQISNKKANLQWLQDRDKTNGVDLNNVRREASRHFSSKTGNMSKTKLMSLKRTIRTRMLQTCIEE